jgi:hypothetical protein
MTGVGARWPAMGVSSEGKGNGERGEEARGATWGCHGGGAAMDELGGCSSASYT